MKRKWIRIGPGKKIKFKNGSSVTFRSANDKQIEEIKSMGLVGFTIIDEREELSRKD